ncbi:MAG: OadG family protein [Clostridia bacterium]|nr:OadG family protein [Clostridia bacterium]
MPESTVENALQTVANQPVDWARAVTIFILGVGTVFAVLIILWAILAVMKVIFARPAKDAPAAASAPAQNSLNSNNKQSSRKMSTPKKIAKSAPQDENELVALLNGAVAGYTGVTNLRVKSYKKVK